ncbi:hypothetical protein CY652_01005 [Burkholderia sp. WAC0059]|uniref:beta-ketoacyl synthase chain length factor n=1 Tax=Burkholderia sp. WAC0059 TaxID=2066022 RepID=UPI000C7F4E22|nr:beta-ketoacyl synthase chain length factor [Burkholderia sp. WAC0059]PLZ04285.1 hypothetical protein CY652_01005 [Burkholderia sp. WAC0059]
MPDLHWTVPVARWSSWPDGTTIAPDLGFIEPMVRRRLSALSKIALKVAHDCADKHQETRLVFASRHGELKRTTDILRAMDKGEPVSPTAFSLSVLNAMSGIFSIARADRSGAQALSAGSETLGYGLLEAFAQHEEDGASPVLLVYADEPAGATHGAVDDDAAPGALALLIGARGAAGTLECAVTGAVDAADGVGAAGGVQTPAGFATFASQRAAVLNCLATRAPSAWRSALGVWQWSWHDAA